MRARIPDPNDPATFEACKLDWAAPATAAGRDWLGFVRGLLDIRRREIVPRLAGAAGHAGRVIAAADGVIAVDWRLDGADLRLRANLSEADAAAPAATGRRAFRDAGRLPAALRGAGRAGGATMSVLEDLVRALRDPAPLLHHRGRGEAAAAGDAAPASGRLRRRRRHRDRAEGEPRRRAARGRAAAPRARRRRLPPARLARRRPGLGAGAAALPAPLGAQLGNRRLRRPRRDRADGRRRGRRLHRAQPAARAAPGRADAVQPVLAVEPALPQPALHRRRRHPVLRHALGPRRCPGGRARLRTGRLPGRGRAQARRAPAALADRARRSRGIRPVPRRRRPGARASCPLRGDLRPDGRRGPRRRLDQLARGAAGSRERRRRRVRRPAPRRHRLPRLAAMAGRPPARRGPRRGAPRRHAPRPLPRLRGRRGARRLQHLVRPPRDRARGPGRRTPRLLQRRRSGLAAGAALPGGDGRHPRRPVPRADRSRHPPRGGAAHRPRDGALAALPDAGRRHAGGRHLRPLPDRGDAHGARRRQPAPTAPSSSARTWATCPKASAR